MRQKRWIISGPETSVRASPLFVHTHTNPSYIGSSLLRVEGKPSDQAKVAEGITHAHSRLHGTIIAVEVRGTVLAIDPSTAFVSYSREDGEFVLRLAKDLKTKGAKVWMDKLDIRPGHRWEVEIETALNDCSRMIIVLSPASVRSTNVLAEAAFAIDEGKAVIPVLHSDCKIPFRLRPFQYADFRTSYEEGLHARYADKWRDGSTPSGPFLPADLPPYFRISRVPRYGAPPIRIPLRLRNRISSLSHSR